MLAQMGSGGPILGYLRSQAPIETITRLLVNQGSQLLVFSKEAILFLIYLLAHKANNLITYLDTGGVNLIIITYFGYNLYGN